MPFTVWTIGAHTRLKYDEHLEGNKDSFFKNYWWDILVQNLPINSHSWCLFILLNVPAPIWFLLPRRLPHTSSAFVMTPVTLVKILFTRWLLMLGPRANTSIFPSWSKTKMYLSLKNVFLLLKSIIFFFIINCLDFYVHYIVHKSF